MESLKESLWGLFKIFLYLPFSLKVLVISGLVSLAGWLIAKWLFWVWNKNDDRGIGHAGRLGRFADAEGFEYIETPAQKIVDEHKWLGLFSLGHKHSIEHLLRRKMGDLDSSVFLFTRDQNAQAGWAGEFFTVVFAFRLVGSNFPDISMTPGPSEGLPDEVVVDEDLARVYTIRAVEKHGVHRFFTPGLVAAFERERDWCIEIGGDRIAFWRPMRCETAEAHGHGVAGEPLDPATYRMPVKELKGMIEETRAMFGLIAAAAGRSVDTAERPVVPRSRRNLPSGP